MTKQEKIIVSAYTGVLMCNFEDLHKYIEELLERPVLTHELADEKICQEIAEKCRADFLELCRNDTTISYDFYAAAGAKSGGKTLIQEHTYLKASIKNLFKILKKYFGFNLYKSNHTSILCRRNNQTYLAQMILENNDDRAKLINALKTIERITGESLFYVQEN